jgi:hypothetical protein
MQATSGRFWNFVSAFPRQRQDIGLYFHIGLYFPPAGKMRVVASTAFQGEAESFSFAVTA